MREVIARNPIQTVLTGGERKLRLIHKKLCKKFQIIINLEFKSLKCKHKKLIHQKEVIDSFRDVQAAKADKERQQNEADAYANDVIPRARGEAAQIVQQAEGYKNQVVASAEGEASRFLAIYDEYKNAKAVTQNECTQKQLEKVLAGI